MRIRCTFGLLAMALSSLVWAAATYDIGSVMAAILRTESGGRSYAIFDNTTRRSYYLSSREEAVKMASYLVSLNHNIDMGDYQINSIHLSRSGWTIAKLFESTFNRNAAETIFTEWLNRAKKTYGDTQLAWERAIGAYNAGFAGLRNGNPVYVNKVLRAMGSTSPPLDKPAPDIAASDVQRRMTKQLAINALGDEDDDFEIDLNARRRANKANAREIQELATVAGLALLLLAGFAVLGKSLLKFAVSLTVTATRKAMKKAQTTAQSI